MAVIDPRFVLSSSPMGAATILRAVNAFEHAIDAGFRAVRLAEARRRTRTEIKRLSARQLTDIGLVPGALDEAVERRVR
ncbi:MAG: hypothetical protein ACJAWZ_004101 [Paracoccaceae bacterium]|jgi:uncharacterized protein YjiS (DUF1127 family)